MPAHPPPPHPSPSSCMAVCLLSQNDYVSATFSSSLGPCSYFFDLSQICFPFLSCLPLPDYALGISPSICICLFSDLFPSFQVSASKHVLGVFGNRRRRKPITGTRTWSPRYPHSLSHMCSFPFPFNILCWLLRPAKKEHFSFQTLNLSPP